MSAPLGVGTPMVGHASQLLDETMVVPAVSPVEVQPSDSGLAFSSLKGASNVEWPDADIPPTAPRAGTPSTVSELRVVVVDLQGEMTART